MYLCWKEEHVLCGGLAMNFDWVEVSPVAVDRKWDMLVSGKFLPYAQIFWFEPGFGALPRPRYEVGFFPGFASERRKFNNLPAAKRFAERRYYSSLFD